jgi:hypothetical protein
MVDVFLIDVNGWFIGFVLVHLIIIIVFSMVQNIFWLVGYIKFDWNLFLFIIGIVIIIIILIIISIIPPILLGVDRRML